MVCLDVAGRIMNPNVGLYLRDSMNKFDSNSRLIDIVRVSSAPSSGFLNRQIILLLCSLGIRDEVFLNLQNEMLDQLRTLTTNYQRASQFLNQFGEHGGNGYNTFLLEYLKRFSKQIDPFARQILLAFQAFLVKDLRTKAHIVVPETWFLFGVADETRTLQYGEVFIQIEENCHNGNYIPRIITGPVVVTRNPCFHPGNSYTIDCIDFIYRHSIVGDIRRLVAVDIPALHPLKNVIVFPIHGPRSHPAEMSGGDLDGDTFWICQENKLLFDRNEEPFDYHDQATEDAEEMEPETGTVYRINDVCKFFVKYIEADK